MHDNIISCIKNRRSVRNFQLNQVEDELLLLLLEAAVWAPSGSNTQNRYFTAVQNKNLLLLLNEEVKKAFQRYMPDLSSPSKTAAKVRSEREDYDFCYHAPTLIIASSPPENVNGMADCSAAIQNIMLAAHSLNLGTCWINQLRWLSDDRQLNAFLLNIGLPENHIIYGSVAVGYPTAFPAAPKRNNNITLIIK